MIYLNRISIHFRGVVHPSLPLFYITFRECFPLFNCDCIGTIVFFTSSLFFLNVSPYFPLTLVHISLHVVRKSSPIVFLYLPYTRVDSILLLLCRQPVFLITSFGVFQVFVPLLLRQFFNFWWEPKCLIYSNNINT